MIIIHAHIKVKQEARETFLEEVQGIIKDSNAEEGNISYKLVEETFEPNTFIMVEEWKDQEAINFHNETAHFKTFNAKAIEFLAEPIKVNLFDATKI